MEVEANPKENHVNIEEILKGEIILVNFYLIVNASLVASFMMDFSPNLFITSPLSLLPQNVPALLGPHHRSRKNERLRS